MLRERVADEDKESVMAVETRTTMNGLDVNQLFGTLEAIKGDPGLARFQFRARNRWIDGGLNRSTIRDFYGGG